MSFDLFIQRFERGIPSPIGRADVLLFLRQNANLVQFKQNADDPIIIHGCEIFLSPAESTPEMVNGLTVSRPTEGLSLCEGMFALISIEGCILYGPGTRIFAGNPDTAIHLPIEMIDVLGSPRLVKSAIQLLDDIKAGN